ncbi:cytidine deaminase [Brevibacillus choshinensis]|uniref:cytidine deaminase n=1 Tax=Brevibacillus choshinensis TaxID=54911 RepID=UPI002E250A8B|nr:cytidine deaminase [Brevibacillus choshinensis]
MNRVDTKDIELIEAAKQMIRARYKEGKHHVGAAVRTKSGKVYAAVNLEAYIGRVAVCAEAIALGKAISEGEDEFETIVAVLADEEGDARIVSPCGICRELISDYGQAIHVLLPQGQEEYSKTGILELLPAKYKRE